MTATPGAGLDRDSRTIIRQYYLAMSVPFGIDVFTSAVYAAINAHPLSLLALSGFSTVFLLVGVGTAASLLIRPVVRFLAGQTEFAEVEGSLTRLPRRSATVVACLYGPMLALRMLAPRLGYTFGATIDSSAWIDTICSLLVVTSFNYVLTFFVVSAYLDGLCAHLFRARGINIGAFRGAFRRKIGLALLFVSFAAMTLLAGDIASYEGDRLVREATVDLTASIVGAATIYYWISRALTLPITRLDHGMRRVAAGDLEIRLPVTSDDEVGHAISGFNQMVDGLAEREYLRDTFGKYVSESVAAAILNDQQRGGRVADTLAEATVMFIDIEGFTTLSESLQPAEVASILNTYLGTVVPVIQHNGGVVNSFIGDGLFATFNLPLPLEHHAAAAIRAALEIQKLVRSTLVVSGTPVRVRIGINTGPVIGVTIGSENRLHYTLLGDAVNVASRVEQLNKQFGSQILATESTVRAAGDGFPCERLGETGMRGHRGDVVVYKVEAP
ncbi:MAG: HAMP domain-containing protein [Reyranella sp.]|uniref:adenylate/guanylate cyclase domain-containing protein n=1 Tax=Reyranella sp. TaxID=1929291 RepID=UPI001AD2B59E|nr:adenylate/guanylate cyclase domain-containing protein [Reyranella sp.]MBN9090348.1 HAMP domain-containing protein [Reyranella sp.]